MNHFPAPAPARVVRLSDQMPRGMAFARAAIARAKCGGSATQAVKYAETTWGQDCLPSRILKAAVSAISGGDLAGDVAAAGVEFMGAVRDGSVIGPLLKNGLRRRPIQTRYLTSQGPMTGSWTSEGSAVPILPMSFTQASLGLLKVGSIIVLTDEELQAADGEEGIRRDLIGGLAAAVDLAFLDPGNSGVAGETPASVTAGLTPVAVGTGDEEDVRDALATMVDQFEGDLTRAVFVGRPELFSYLHGLGYDECGLRGGSLLGAPAVASRGLPNAGGMYQLALLDPSGIAYADDGTAAQITASTDAALEMRDDPVGSSTTPTAANLVSLFQVNCTAVKALAFANWSVEQSGAVVLGAFVPVGATS